MNKQKKEGKMENSDIRLKFNELKIKFYSTSKVVDEIARKNYKNGLGKLKEYRELEKYLEDLSDKLFKIMDDNSELFPDKTEIKTEYKEFVRQVENRIEGKIAGLGLR